MDLPVPLCSISTVSVSSFFLVVFVVGICMPLRSGLPFYLCGILHRGQGICDLDFSSFCSFDPMCFVGFVRLLSVHLSIFFSSVCPVIFRR